MMNESKSTLARLLATENIIIEQRACKTASFDVTRRVLTLPMWANDMSVSLADMLIGHEVGHALHTPAEGWHGELDSAPNFKTFLNVIEDIRIERKIKDRYPGLRKQFFEAYNELFEKDFFGIGESDVNALLLIDRINVRYKLGVRVPVSFATEEAVFIKRCDALDTWEDTVALAKDLYEYCKEEKKQKKQEEAANGDDGDDEEGEEGDDDSFDIDFDDADETASDDIEESDDADSTEGKSDENEPTDEDNDDPASTTDIAFRSAEDQLAQGISTPQMYVYLPEVDLDRMLIKAKDLSSNELYFSRLIGAAAPIAQWENDIFRDFNNKNSSYINYLVKEFELRKNARQLMKARQSKTGMIDINKVWSYQFNEDIFLTNTDVPGGKNHGLVMLVDWSASMTTNIKNTIEQVLVQVAFCRKANIPFSVLAFQSKLADKFIQNTFVSGFEAKQDNLFCGDLTLIELISSDLRGNEFNLRFRKLLGLSHLLGGTSTRIVVDGHSWSIYESLTPGRIITLGSTPLNAALLAMPQFIKQFQSRYKVDIMNLMVLTDGEDTNSPQFYNENDAKMPLRYNMYDRHAYLCNRKSMLKVRIHDSDILTKYILQHIKDILQCNLIGFFIVDKNPKRTIMQYSGMWQYSGVLDGMLRTYKENKFIGLTNCGYDEYFLIAGGKDLAIAPDVIEAKDHKKASVLRAFMKNQTRKGHSRVFLRQLVKRLAIAA